MNDTTPSAVKPRPIPQATWTPTDGLPARAAQVIEYARWTAEDKCGAGYLRAYIERDETSGDWIAAVVTLLPGCRLSAPMWRPTAEEAMEAADDAAARILEAMLGLGMSALCVEVEEGAEERASEAEEELIDRLLAMIREHAMSSLRSDCGLGDLDQFVRGYREARGLSPAHARDCLLWLASTAVKMRVRAEAELGLEEGASA